MSSTLDKQLAAFLKKQRGEMTYAAFGRKLGMTPSTIFRLEHCEQSITLGKLDHILGRLKVDLGDVFGVKK